MWVLDKEKGDISYRGWDFVVVENWLINYLEILIDDLLLVLIEVVVPNLCDRKVLKEKD